MGLGVRHLITAGILSLLLLVFYLSLSNEPFTPLLRSSAHSPAIVVLGKEASLTTTAESKTDASDPVVLQQLQSKFIFPPSTDAYNLQNPENVNPSMGQAQAIDYILNKKRDGFFIECGGLDGELRSNSLFFERERGWQGLVIEADPANFAQMKVKNRHAFTSPTCLATTAHPSKVVFAQNSNRGHIYEVESYDDAPALGFVNVQCFPLYSYMLALNRTTVDYFSLDVEGAEYKVLLTVPWDKVDIKTISVEFLHVSEGKTAIRELMESKGYVLYTEVTEANNLANDFIFIKKNLFR